MIIDTDFIKRFFAIILFLLQSISSFSQKTNVIESSIIYLPAPFRYEYKINKIPKNKVEKIDKLIIQKTFELPLTEEEINVIKDLYISKNSFGISQNKYQQIINSNILSIDFNEKDSIKMNFTEILSAVIDGAPFKFHLKTKSNELIFESNLGGIAKPDEFHKYLIFYLIYNNEIQFGKKSNKSLKTYFSSEKMIKSAMWYLYKFN